MNSIIDLLQLYLPQFYSLALLGIIYLIWSLTSPRSFQSDQGEEDIDEETESYSFRKGKTEYYDPPRSHSPIFNEVFKLAFLGGPFHHQKMTFILSNLIKENLELKSQTKKLEYSENLSNLMNDPYQWFRLQYDKMAQLGISHQVEFLNEQYEEILKEVEEIMDLSFFPKSESEVRK
ncbi:MAG: hypothetical protein ACFFCZ_02910 [Promethearchaeota archaeon]